MSFNDYLTSVYDWVSSNLWQIAFTLISLIGVYSVYKLLTRQITRLKEQQKLEENVAFMLHRILQWTSGVIVVVVFLSSFGIQLGVVASLFALAGGTIIGFAAMNTIGNAIAGFIIMTSRPFRIGDRIFFNGKFADVVSIDLVYTRMTTLDNVLVSVPNQELLNTEIDNYGKKTVVRRHCVITADYELSADHVEKVLLDAANKVTRILKNPKPYVRITDFKDYAVEYTLYVFINNIQRLREIDANLNRTVLEMCKSHKIDISTPLLIRSIESD